MEILINELSLTGQFATIPDFLKDGLIPITAILKGLDREKDIVLKKQDFWDNQVTSTENLHQVRIQKSDEATRFKSVLSSLNSLMGEPYWEDSRKHNNTDTYKHNTVNIIDSSLAESCERDKIVISFIHTNFSNYILQVLKNGTYIDIDNLFQKEHYIEVAYSRNQIDKCEYFERKFAFGLITLLENECQFTKTNKLSKQNTPIYKDGKGNYWHLDNVHNHYEVYNSNEEHIGVANSQGNIDTSKKVNGRTL